MKISIKSSGGAEKAAAVFLFQDGGIPACLSKYKKFIQPLIKDGVFKASKKASFCLPLPDGSYLSLVGLGAEKSFCYEGVRQACAKAYKGLKFHKLGKADLILESMASKKTSNWEELSRAAAEGLTMAAYSCGELKKPPKKPPFKMESLFLSAPSAKRAAAQKGLKTGLSLGEAVNFAKRLADYPGNLMTPSILADKIKKQTQNTKIKTQIWDKKRIEKEKMGGLFGVSLGSSQEPRFIIMEYKGAGPSKKPVALVGKGLTFDSGGISLKPSNSMEEMKFDMCGAAAVAGAMLAIEKLNLKVNVTGFIPSSENMPGASANKPGDILTARNGKTMEVLNTDAEGRLILADALCIASEHKPQAIFDAATLTGAILFSLGNIFTGFFTKDENLVKKIHQAGERSGERVWRLPLTEEHSQDIKSSLADVANISSTRGAGSSTAAAFLENFVDKNIPWAHFDIAGTAWNTHNRLEYCSQKMASGVMVRTFVELARSFE